MPPIYSRTAAPRLTAKGGTLHGMKRVLAELVLKDLSAICGGSFVDVDLSAAHAHIAAAVQNKAECTLNRLICKENTNFWNDHASTHTKLLNQAGVQLKEKQVRSMLKVSFYRSLNALLYKTNSDVSFSVSEGF